MRILINDPRNWDRDAAMKINAIALAIMDCPGNQAEVIILVLSVAPNESPTSTRAL